MPKRRTTILGLGALAMGSGAAFTSATFQNSVDADADFRVRVDQALVVEAGAAFEDDGSVAGDVTEDRFINPDHTGASVGDDFYAGESELGDVFDEQGEDEDPPLATVSKRDETNNGTLETYAAVDFLNVDGDGGNSVTFEDILQVRNESGHTVEVGIAYDRDEGEDGSPGQYGDDVGGGNNEVEFDIVQEVYQFKVDGGETTRGNGGDLISPEPGSEGVADGEEGIGNNDDKPANVVEIDSGETVQIDLEITIDESARGEIRSAAGGLDPDEFGEAPDLVDLLDEITVGTVSGEE